MREQQPLDGGTPEWDRQVQHFLRSPRFPVWLTVAGGIIALLGTLLPWRTYSGFFATTETSNGGLLAILLTLAVTALGVWMLARSQIRAGQAVAVLVCSSLLLIICIANIVIAAAVSGQQYVSYTIDGGLYLTAIGTFMTGGAALLLMRRNSAATPSPQPTVSAGIRSGDGKHVWDGALWRQLSDDGLTYWDGAAWRDASQLG
jgi:hypothetical protein